MTRILIGLVLGAGLAGVVAWVLSGPNWRAAYAAGWDAGSHNSDNAWRCINAMRRAG